ncbi:MAG: SRPBCC family protein [Planctomycetota bacterium]
MRLQLCSILFVVICVSGCTSPIGDRWLMNVADGDASGSAELVARTHLKPKEPAMGIKTTAEVSRSIFVDVPREQVWRITGEEFANIDRWIAGVNASEGAGVGLNGAPCTERTCEPSFRGFQETTERLIQYDPQRYQLAYQIVEGLPGMVGQATNEWTHQEKGQGTQVTMTIKMELHGIVGAAMKPMMSRQMGKILQEGLEELKVYAETGQQHPRKLAAMAKYHKKLTSQR